MKWTPRRILFHVIIVLVTLAFPLLLPSSCGPAVHSEGRSDSRNLKLLTHYRLLSMSTSSIGTS